MNIVIREATENDIPAICDIRNHYILNSLANVNIRPRTLEETSEWVLDVSKRYPFVVADIEGVIAAYGALLPYRATDGYYITAEVTLYVRPEYKRRGIGRLLLETLCAGAPGHGLHCLVSVITGKNEASVRLHETFGFAVAGILKEAATKYDEYVDIILMTKLV